jgi:hypothetical protein
MAPNRFTHLFFLDEATAFAAGHRPCAECRHARFLDFCNAWKAVHPEHGGAGRPTADEIDQQLHAERLTPDRTKRSYAAALDELPDGVFVTVDGGGGHAHLTPRSTVAAIRAGYVPEVHASADSKNTRV